MKTIAISILICCFNPLRAEVISARQSASSSSSFSSHGNPSPITHIRYPSPSADLRAIADEIGERSCYERGTREKVVGQSNCLSLQAAIVHLHGSPNSDGSRPACSSTPASAGGARQDMDHAIACDVFATFLSKTPCNSLDSLAKRAQCSALVRGEQMDCGTPGEYGELEEVACHSIKNAFNGTCPATVSISRRYLAQTLCEAYRGLSLGSYVRAQFPR